MELRPQRLFFETYRASFADTGLENALDHIQEHRNPDEQTLVYLPHHQIELNENLLQNAHDSPDRKSSSGRDEVAFVASMFRHGGWHQPGGIPDAFFTADYIITSPDLVGPWGIVDNYFYHTHIASRLAEGNDAYLDGLVRVSETTNHRGQRIVTFRRERASSARHFWLVVRDLAAYDRDNIWNLPYLYAAWQIEPESWQTEQLDRLTEPDFQHPFRIDEDYARRIERARAAWRDGGEPVTYETLFEGPDTDQKKD